MRLLERLRTWWAGQPDDVQAELVVLDSEPVVIAPRIALLSKVVARESGVPTGCDKHNVVTQVVRAHSVSPM